MAPKLKILICFTIFCGILYSNKSVSQTNTKINKKFFIVYPNLIGDIIVRKGFLYQVMDSSIIILKENNGIKPKDFPIFQSLDSIHQITSKSFRFGCKKCPSFAAINYKILDNVYIRRKHNPGKGLLLGGVTGLVIGSIGAIIVRQYTAGLDPIAAMVFAPTAIGICTGLIIGSIKIKIPIQESLVNFESNRSKLKKYSKIKY